jgi:hypothetical protein
MLALDPLQGSAVVRPVVLRSRLRDQISEPARVALFEHGRGVLLDKTLSGKLSHGLQEAVAELVGPTGLG